MEDSTTRVGNSTTTISIALENFDNYDLYSGENSKTTIAIPSGKLITIILIKLRIQQPGCQ